MRLTKTDANSGDALQGAVFDLYNASGRKVATKTTDQSGRLTVYGLYPGKYFFVEVTPRQGICWIKPGMNSACLWAAPQRWK